MQIEVDEDSHVCFLSGLNERRRRRLLDVVCNVISVQVGKGIPCAFVYVHVATVVTVDFTKPIVVTPIASILLGNDEKLFHVCFLSGKGCQNASRSINTNTMISATMMARKYVTLVSFLM